MVSVYYGRLQQREALQGEDTSVVIVLSERAREREGEGGRETGEKDRKVERREEREREAVFSGSPESLAHTRC